MTTSKRNASTPNYHIAGARTGRKTTVIVPREAIPWLALILALAILAAIVWGVFVPASEAALDDARMSYALSVGGWYA